MSAADPIGDQSAEPTGPAGAGSRSAVIRAGLLTMIALVALGLVRFLHMSLVSHATTKSNAGLVGELIAIATITSLLVPAGVASAAAKFIPFFRGREDLPTARGAYRMMQRLALVSSLGLGAAAAILTDLVKHLSLSQTVLLGLLTAALSLYGVDKAVLYGFNRVSAYVRLELITSGTAIALTVLVVSIGATVYLAPLAIGYSLFVVGARWLVRRDAQGDAAPVPVRFRREMLGYIGLASLGTLASQGFLQGTQLLVDHYDRGLVVYFSVSVALVAPMYFLPRALSLALFPTMAHAHGAGDREEVRRQADVFTRALLALLAPAFVVGVLVAREVLWGYAGPSYRPGALVLQLMLAAVYCAVVAVASVNSLSSGTPRQVLFPVLSGVAGCLIGIGVIAVLGPGLGATGVAIGYLVGTFVTAAGPLVATWRLHRMPWNGPVLRAAGAVAGAVVVARILDVVVGQAGWRWVADLAAGVLGLAGTLLVLRGDLRVAWLLRPRREPAAASDAPDPAGPAAVRAPQLAHPGSQ